MPRLANRAVPAPPVTERTFVTIAVSIECDDVDGTLRDWIGVKTGAECEIARAERAENGDYLFTFSLDLTMFEGRVIHKELLDGTFVLTALDRDDAVEPTFATVRARRAAGDGEARLKLS